MIKQIIIQGFKSYKNQNLEDEQGNPIFFSPKVNSIGKKTFF